MSTETIPRARVASRASFALVVATMVTVSIRAADVDFRPTLTFGVVHDGNVAVIGSTTDKGDDIASLAFDLAVDRKTPVETLTFSYRPTYSAYRTNDDLNYFGQSASLVYTRTPSRSATYSFELDGSRTERQGVRTSDPSAATTFLPRSMQTHVNVGALGELTGRRNIFNWEVRSSLDDYSQADYSGTAQPSTCVVDADCDDGNGCTVDTCSAGLCTYMQSATCDLQRSTGARVAGSWRYEVNPKNSVGLGLIVDSFWYSTLPSAANESLGLVGESAFGRATSMNYSAGVSNTRSDGVSDQNVVGSVSISNTFSEVSTLKVEIRRAASQGSGLGGVSIDQGGYLAYNYTPHHRGLTGSVVAAYWKRDPPGQTTTTSTPSTTTISTNASLGWNFNRFLSLSVGHSYSDQTSSDPTTLDTHYSVYGFSLTWAIRGREGVNR